MELEGGVWSYLEEWKKEKKKKEERKAGDFKASQAAQATTRALHSHKIGSSYVLNKSWDAVWKYAMANSRWWSLISNGYSKHEAQRRQTLGHQ